MKGDNVNDEEEATSCAGAEWGYVAQGRRPSSVCTSACTGHLHASTLQNHNFSLSLICRTCYKNRTVKRPKARDARSSCLRGHGVWPTYSPHVIPLTCSFRLCFPHSTMATAPTKTATKAEPGAGPIALAPLPVMMLTAVAAPEGDEANVADSALVVW